MKIVVIGRTGRSRSRTIWELRREGHDVVAARPTSRREMSVEAPRDPGYAGEPLRRLLISIGLLFRDAWLGSRKHLANRERVSAGIEPDAKTPCVLLLDSRQRRSAPRSHSPEAASLSPNGRAIH